MFKMIMTVIVKFYVWLFAENKDQAISDILVCSRNMARLKADKKRVELLHKKEREEPRQVKVSYLTVVKQEQVEKVDYRKQFKEWKSSMTQYDSLRSLFVAQGAME
jgi:hypothetical protein